MTCQSERVTGWVDGALDAADRVAVLGHLATCPVCRDQADFERDLRARLRALPSPEPRPELLAAVRARLLRARPRRRFMLPLAAALAGLVLWGRGAAPLVAWELARDHAHCFAKAKLPAKVWSGDPLEVARWFEEHGTYVPPLPAGRSGLSLVGARYCPLLDRVAAHVYYANEDHHLSVFVISGPARFTDEHATESGGRMVRLLRSGDATVAVVAENNEDARAFEHHFTTTIARGDVPLDLPAGP